MAIIKILVVDPEPRSHLEDVVVFQVPEHSRTHALLIDMLTAHNYEYVEVEIPRHRVRSEPADLPAFLRKQAD